MADRVRPSLGLGLAPMTAAGIRPDADSRQRGSQATGTTFLSSQMDSTLGSKLSHLKNWPIA